MAVAYIPQTWAKPEHPSEFIPNLDALIQDAAQRHGVDPNFIADIIMHESGGLNIPTRIPPPPGQVYTAYGPMQTIAGHYTNPEDRKDPVKNIDTGTRYFASLMKRYNGDPYDAIRAYAIGEGNVDKWIKNGRSLTGLSPKVLEHWTDGEKMVRYLQGRVASRKGTGAVATPPAQPQAQPENNAGTYYSAPAQTPTTVPNFQQMNNALMRHTWNNYIIPNMPEETRPVLSSIGDLALNWNLGSTYNGYNNGWQRSPF